MAADRLVTISTTPGTKTGNSYMDEVQEEVTGLWDRSLIKLGSVSGTNAITATPSPALTGALVDGMNFLLVPANTNTSATITLDVGTGAKTVVTNENSAPLAGQVKAAATYLLTWDSGLNKFRILTYLPALIFSDRPSYRNIIMPNGGFEIWQRGAGNSASIAVAASTTTGAYTADRWYLITNATQACVVSAQAGLSSRSRFCARVQRNSGQTGVGTLIFAYPLTTDECIRFRGSKVTLQMLLRAGANWSPTSGAITYALYFGTGTEGKRGGGFTGESAVIGPTVVNVTASGSATVSATSSATVGTTVTQGELRLSWTPVGTASTNDYIEIDDVQAENGEIATEFEYATFASMLSECQRHYCKTFPYGTAPAQSAGAAGALAACAIGDVSADSRAVFVEWRFPCQMRTAPTITTYNPSSAAATWQNITGAGSATQSVDPSSLASADHTFITTSTGAGSSANRDLFAIHAQANAGL
jgi:hypothetical protein